MSKCVLVIDKEFEGISTWSSILKKHFEFTEVLVLSVEEAEHQVESKIDLYVVCLDVRNAFGLLNMIRSSVVNASTPIIALSLDTSEPFISKAFELGADDFIVRPFRDTDFMARVQHTYRCRRCERNQLLEPLESLSRRITAISI